MMKPALIGAACALFLASVPDLAQAGLVTNGGFETGDLTGWTLAADPANTFVTGGFNHSGNFALWMGEVGQLGTLSQTLATVAGTQYSLSFWFAGDGDTPSEFQALIDNTLLLQLVNPPFDANYVNYTYTFTAATSSTLLRFRFRDDPFFINLDDIDVVEAVVGVPEPTSLALVTLSGLLLAAASASRRGTARRPRITG